MYTRHPAPPASTLFPYTTLFRSSYKKFAGVDAGMNDFPRPSTYGAYHHISVLGKDDTEKGPINVVGRLCENNDQFARSEEHTSELQSLRHLVCRLLLEKKKNYHNEKRTSGESARQRHNARMPQTP